MRRKTATEDGIPKMIVINGMDKEGADFDEIRWNCARTLGTRVSPLDAGESRPGFNQLLDVPRSEIITYAGDKSGSSPKRRRPARGRSASKQAHERLIEYIAEADDTLMEKWMEKGSLTEAELRAGLTRRCRNSRSSRCSARPRKITSAWRGSWT